MNNIHEIMKLKRELMDVNQSLEVSNNLSEATFKQIGGNKQVELQRLMEKHANLTQQLNQLNNPTKTFLKDLI